MSDKKQSPPDSAPDSPAETPVLPHASLPDRPPVGFGAFREGTNIELGRMQDSGPPPTVSATAPEPAPPKAPGPPPPSGGADEGAGQD